MKYKTAITKVVIYLTVLALIFSVAGSAPAQALTPSASAGFLNPDGTLNINKLSNGALDLAGWNVQMDPLRGPVFAPAAQAAPGQWASLQPSPEAALTGYGAVLAIAVSGADIYVGGNFVDVNNNGTILPEADYIAKWNTQTGTWSTLGSNGAGDGALSNNVYAIAVSGTDVYVGGDFVDVNNNGTLLPEADYMAKWDMLTGTWSALGSNGFGDGSLNSSAKTIAVSGTDVYIGGDFIDVNNNGTLLPAADYITKWDTLTGNWSALGSNGAGNGPLNSGVAAIAVSGTNVYVGGGFTNVNNNGVLLPEADFIAKWDTQTGNWSALGSNGVDDGALIGSGVNAIAVSGTDVYVGGSMFVYFTDTVTETYIANYVAKWDTLTSTWSALGSQNAISNSVEGVNAIAVSGTDVYVGGNFLNVNGLPAADFIAKWDALTGSWSALGSNEALNNQPYALAVSGTDLYVGGNFLDVNNNGTVLPDADAIAKWDTLTGNWSAFDFSGTGISALGDEVYAITVSGTDVYVGGFFTDVNDNGTILPAADYIAKWDTLTSTWSALGSNGAGNGALTDGVAAIAVSGTDVYVGGWFSNVNNNGVLLPEADFIAKWDAQTGNWSALGSNGAGGGALNSVVYALAVRGADVYAGGEFFNVNNNGTVLPAADSVAKWDTLTGTWSALGSNGAGNGSLNNTVRTIAVNGTDVYVGGGFADVNNNGTLLPAADYITKWDTQTGNWSALGSNGAGNGSLNNGVEAIAVSGTDVYVGGFFTNVNNNGSSLPAADNIAKWDTLTSNWSALGSNGSGNGSLNATVNAIMVSGTNVYVGGNFTNVNNNGTLLTAADYVTKWDTQTGNWSAFGSDGAGNGSLNFRTNTITVSGTDLYVGGGFTDVNNNGTPLPAADDIAVYGIVVAAPTATPTATATVTKTSTATVTVTASPTVTATASTTVTSTASKTPTTTTTATSTITLTPTASKTATHTATATSTFTPTASNTAANTATATPTITLTPTASNTVTHTATATSTFTPTATNTAANTATATSTFTLTPTPSNTAIATATATYTSTPTATNTAANTATATSTFTLTPTASNTATDTVTATYTPTPTATNTTANTATATSTLTLTPTLSNTVTATITATATNTDTAAVTSTPTATATATVTPSLIPATATRTATTTRTATATPTVNLTPVTVTINQAAGQSDPTNTQLLSFTAVFSEAVSGFTSTDVTVSPSVACAPAVAITGSGTTYNVALTSMNKECTVTVSIPAGMVNSISRPAAVNAASSSTDNSQTFAYAVKAYTSIGANDGWILESAVGTNLGGSINNSATTMSVGDDSANKEYRILSRFDTSVDPIPATAIIAGGNYRVTQVSITGTNPLTTHGSLRTFLNAPYFGTSASLEAVDYQSAGDTGACIFDTTLLSGSGYRCLFFTIALSFIPKSGVLDLRSQFDADNADSSADLLNINSGNAAGQKPQLFVTYYLLP